MNDLQEIEVEQQTDETVSSNGQAGAADPFTPIYGDFNTAAEFLNSLDGRLAAERDKLRAQYPSDPVVADRILSLKDEAKSLRFTAVLAGRTGVMSITAWVVRDAGEEALDVGKLDPSDVPRRIEYAQRLSAIHPAIDAVKAERLLMQLAAEHSQRQHEQPAAPPDEPTAEELLKQTPPQVVEEARATLEAPDLMDIIVADVQGIGVAGESDLIKAIYLVAVSRKLPETCKAIVQSASATGKTITVRRTTACIPPEDIIRANSITAHVLYYMGRDALKNKLVVAGERKKQQGDEQADATAAIRQMLSDNQISKLTTDTSTSPPTARFVEIDGPIAYIETTTSNSTGIFDEDLNRCLLLSADEQPEQTRLVLRYIAKLRSGAQVADRNAIIQRHHAMQRMLRQRMIVIPFAAQLAEKFNAERPEARRAFGQLLGMVEASALLHQFQRQIDEGGRIIATLADYSIAADLCRTPLARLLGGKISDAAIRFHKRLQEWVGAKFTTTEARKTDNKTRQAVIGWLEELVSIGAADQVEASKGSRPAVWKLTNMAKEEVAKGGFRLPTVVELESDQEPEPEPALEPEPEADETYANTFSSTDDDSDYVSPF